MSRINQLNDLSLCPICGRVKVARVVANKGAEDVRAKLKEWGYCSCNVLDAPRKTRA